MLAGFTSGKPQRDYFLSGKAVIYHMPVGNKTIRNLDKLRYFCPIIDGVEEYYVIDNIKVVPRKDVFPLGSNLYDDKPEPYYVFTLKNRKRLHRKIDSAAGGNRVFRYARLSELNTSKTIDDFNKISQEGM